MSQGLKPIDVLHFYYTRASGIRECLRQFPSRRKKILESLLQSTLLPNFVKKYLQKIPMIEGMIDLMDKANLLLVFYGLLYVVVEAYQDQGMKDEKIDALLKSENVDLLRKLRNGVFHFQKDLDTHKILNFLQKDESEIWIKSLFSAFGDFFMKNIRDNWHEKLSSLE